MRSSQRVWLLLIGLLIGAFVGRLSGHQLGETFSLPTQPDPNRWRIISAGLVEGIGKTGVGRITHIANGALNLATHVFIRPDMAVPQFNGEANSVWIELAPDSGPLWAQIGPPPGRFVRFKPGGVSTGSIGEAWQEVGEASLFHLKIEQNQLWVQAGEFNFPVGSAKPGPVELTSIDKWARIVSLKIEDKDGQTLFEDDFRGSRVNRQTLNGATIIGSVMGLSVAMLSLAYGRTRLLMCLALMSPVVLSLMSTRSDWLQAVERLYLDKVPPSSLATLVLLFSLIPLLFAAVMDVVRGAAWRLKALSHGRLVWVFLFGLTLLGLGADSFLSTLVLLMYGLSGLVFGWNRAPSHWWWIDGFGWVWVWVVGVESGPFVLSMWRLISVGGLASLWIKEDPFRAVLLLLFGMTMVPIGAEEWVRNTAAGRAWQMGRLTGERPNEKGWENPASNWTGTCESSQVTDTVDIVVAGGSSVGGAYQFGGEPEAFFTAIAHHILCADLPDGMRLRTHNFGDGDRNTFTISRTIDEHLSDADILVLYVGANDVFTTQNTLTRKQREQEQVARSERLKGVMAWAFESRLMVAASLLLRSTNHQGEAELVADVPLDDARENHENIIAAARKQGVRVLLLTEYVQESHRNQLFDYANMQAGLRVEDGVDWYDVRHAFRGVPDSEALADRNHLSRFGNVRLGEAIAGQLRPWVYGSSL